MQGIYTDYWGNAVVPYLTNYRRNTVTVNSGERDDLDIEKPAKDVVPTKGAVVAANFSARQGIRALLTLHHGSSFVPFGAVLSMEGGSSIVGDRGEVYLTGLKGNVPFKVQWGSAPEQRCEGNAQIPEDIESSIYQAAVECR